MGDGQRFIPRDNAKLFAGGIDKPDFRRFDGFVDGEALRPLTAFFDRLISKPQKKPPGAPPS